MVLDPLSACQPGQGESASCLRLLRGDEQGKAGGSSWVASHSLWASALATAVGSHIAHCS